MAKVTLNSNPVIREVEMQQLKMGQYAVVTEGPHIGEIVVRTIPSGITRSNHTYSLQSNDTWSGATTLKVRILEKGEVITIEV